jgi:hypothetical protein
MKRIAAMALFALVSLGMVSSARAQDHPVRVAIPFDFTFGRVLLPAGTYTISSPTQVAIVLDNGKQSVAVLRSAPAEDDSSRADKAIFNKYGDQHFLREILCSTAHMNVEFPASKMEKKAQIQKASLNNPDRVLLALNN